MRTLFNQTFPLRERRGLHGSQNTVNSRFLPRSQGFPSSQNLDFHANIVHTRRSPFLLDKHTYDFSLRGYSSKHDLVEKTHTVHRHNTLICELSLKAFKSKKTPGPHKVVFTKCVFMITATNVNRVPKSLQ